MLTIARLVAMSFIALVSIPIALGGEFNPWKSQTRPDPLSGEQKADAKSASTFEHLSDVDEKNQIREYVYTIHNTHPKDLLDAKWVDGGDKPILNFTRIAPGGWVSNSFESYARWGSDSKATIKYGPSLQYSKAAELYVTKDSDAEQKPPSTRKLRSTIIVDSRDRDESAPHRVELHLNSVQTEAGVTYELTSAGTRTETFTIPKLTDLLQRDIPGVKVTKSWKKGDRGEFTIGSGETSEFTITMTSAARLVEQPVAIEIRNERTGFALQAQVLLYLPALAR